VWGVAAAVGPDFRTDCLPLLAQLVGTRLMLLMRFDGMKIKLLGNRKGNLAMNPTIR
jgi:hypothetical protein